jgi:hypothetical protein
MTPPGRRIIAQPTSPSTVEVRVREKLFARGAAALLCQRSRRALAALFWWDEADAQMTTRRGWWCLGAAAGRQTCVRGKTAGELMLKPGSNTLMVAASRPATGDLSSQDPPSFEARQRGWGQWSAAIVTKRLIELLELSSRVEVGDVRGRAQGERILLIFDEARHPRWRVYGAGALRPGDPGRQDPGGAPSAGRPRGWFYELVRNPLPETRVVTSAGNANPSRTGDADFPRAAAGADLAENSGASSVTSSWKIPSRSSRGADRGRDRRRPGGAA